MIHVMCGIPGSGKSTLAKALHQQIGGTLIEIDACSDSPRQATAVARARFLHALQTAEPIIWDGTSLTPHRRAWVLEQSKAANRKTKIHVIFCTPELAIIRQGQRERQVPERTIRRAALQFTPPKDNEGWDEIMYYEAKQ